MKHFIKITNFIFVFFFSLTGYSQSVIFSGNIKNPASDQIQVRHANGNDTAFLDEKGNFSMKISIQKANYYTFNHGKVFRYIYIKPGDSIYVSFDASKYYETIKFSGKGSEYCNYLIQRFIYNRNLYKNSMSFYNLDSHDFLLKIDSITTVSLDFLSKWIKNNSMQDLSFIKIEKSKIIYSATWRKLNYPWVYYAFTNKHFNNNGFFTFLDQLNLNDSSLLSIDDYKTFLIYFVRYKAAYKHYSDSLFYAYNHIPEVVQFEVINEEITNIQIKNYLFYTIIKENIKTLSSENATELLALFNKNCKDEMYIKEINNYFNNLSSLQIGKKAPELSGYDANGKLVSLTDFIGKPIYLFLWASWSKACIDDFNSYNIIAQKYQQQFVFFTFSIDENKENWIKTITERKLMGVNLLAKEHMQTKVADLYVFKGLPSYFVINETGYIISSGNPKPADFNPDIIKK